MSAAAEPRSSDERQAHAGRRSTAAAATLHLPRALHEEERQTNAVTKAMRAHA